MDKNSRITRLLKKTFDLRARLRPVTDLRKNPTIPLRTLLMSLFLMPFLSLSTLLGLDRENRTPPL